MPDRIRVMIADDHPIFRHGLRQIIETDSELTVVAEAAEGDAAMRAIETQHPAVAVLDLAMPGKDGLAVARAVQETRLAVAIVFLTMHKDEHHLRAALDVGAKGYVPKDSAALEIRTCIKAVAAGQLYVSPTMSSLLVKRIEESKAFTRANPAIAELTPSERRILKLIAEGLTSRAIAEQMNVGVRTVEHHRRNMATKLGLKGSHALVKFAVKHQSELS